MPRFQTRTSNSGQTDLSLIRSVDDATAFDVYISASGQIDSIRLWYQRTATTCSAGLDTTVLRTGKATLKIYNSDVTGGGVVTTCNGASATITEANAVNLIPITGGNTYTLEFYYKTENRTTASISQFLEYSGLTRTATPGGTSVSGTNDWTLGTQSITTSAGATGLAIRFTVAPGSANEATWIDINSMKLTPLGGLSARAIGRARGRF